MGCKLATSTPCHDFHRPSSSIKLDRATPTTSGTRPMPGNAGTMTTESYPNCKIPYQSTPSIRNHLLYLGIQQILHTLFCKRITFWLPGTFQRSQWYLLFDSSHQFSVCQQCREVSRFPSCWVEFLEHIRQS
jgi:hypothetical protein